jgi:hypothetical protein
MTVCHGPAGRSLSLMSWVTTSSGTSFLGFESSASAIPQPRQFSPNDTRFPRKLNIAALYRAPFLAQCYESRTMKFAEDSGPLQKFHCLQAARWSEDFAQNDCLAQTRF